MRVAVRRPAGYAPQLLFEVSDTGIGIPREKQLVVFEAFRQADGSINRRYGGTGLGLAISSKLVSLMGGQIGLESEPGKGSTFYFWVPLAAAPEKDLPHAPAEATPKHSDSQDQHRTLRVLIAEDNIVNQRLARRMLEKRGHTVFIANNGREAVELLSSNPFDIILMDVQMPEMDGLEATRHIRNDEARNGGHIPILGLTAFAMQDDLDQCRSAGMDVVINKPFEPKHLLETVEKLACPAPV